MNNAPLRALATAAVMAGLFSGCEPPSTGHGIVAAVPPNSAAAPQPPAPPAPPSALPVAVASTAPQVPADSPPESVGADSIPATPVAGPQPQPPPQTQQSPPQTSQPASDQPPIHLSAGVAVPQSLPEGTQMGISIDYRLTGRLNPSAEYVLVIGSSAGEMAIAVKIDAKGGTLQGFLPPNVRPEHQPFNARIDAVRPGSARERASNTAALKTSY